MVLSIVNLIDGSAVALGAALGGPARFFLSGFMGSRVGGAFPVGTLAVNVLGGFLIGLTAAWARAEGWDGASRVWLFLVTGGLGGFTTVSSFSLQTWALARDGSRMAALANIVLSAGLSIAAAAVGLALGGRWLGQGAG